jgi:hypothetical protein
MKHLHPIAILAIVGGLCLGLGKMLLDASEKEGDGGTGSALLGVALIFIGIALLVIDCAVIVHYMPGG